MEATVSRKPKTPKGRDDRAPTLTVTLSGPNIRAKAEELTALIQEQTRVPGLSMATAVVMAVEAELERRKGAK